MLRNIQRAHGDGKIYDFYELSLFILIPEKICSSPLSACVQSQPFRKTKDLHDKAEHTIKLTIKTALRTSRYGLTMGSSRASKSKSACEKETE